MGATSSHSPRRRRRLDAAAAGRAVAGVSPPGMGHPALGWTFFAIAPDVAVLDGGRQDVLLPAGGAGVAAASPLWYRACRLVPFRSSPPRGAGCPSRGPTSCA